MNVAVIGSTNLDYVYKLKALPQKGETVIAKSMQKAAGGKGANQAVAVKRLGEKVLFISCLGKDSNGEYLLKKFAAENISNSGIVLFDEPTGCAIINVDDEGNNTIVVYSGANGMLGKEHVGKYENNIKKAEYIIMQLEIPIPTVEHVIERAGRRDQKVILNPAPAAELSENVYRHLYMITPNEAELKQLTKEPDILKGAQILLQKGIENVVVTLGEKGSFFINKEKEIHVKAFPVKAVDSTAAGDAFNAALAVSLLKGRDIEDGLKFANAAGALAATKIGAQESLPTIKEVENFMDKHT